MSQSLVPIRTHFWMVRALIGCKDEGAFLNHAHSQKKVLAEIDERLDEEELLTADEAAWVKQVREAPRQADPNLDRAEAKFEELRGKLKTGENLDALVMEFAAELQKEFDDVGPAVGAQESKASEAEPPSGREMLRQMMFGEPLDARVGFGYDLISKGLSLRMGQKIKADLWLEIKHARDWFGRLDAELEALGVPKGKFTFTGHLVERGNPYLVDAPVSDVSIGWLSLAEMSELLAVFPAVAGSGDGEDPRAYLSDLRKWMQVCVKNEQDLICFLE